MCLLPMVWLVVVQNRNNVVSGALLRLAMTKNVVITQTHLEKGRNSINQSIIPGRGTGDHCCN